jgi:hypothetical protein
VRSPVLGILGLVLVIGLTIGWLWPTQRELEEA